AAWSFSKARGRPTYHRSELRQSTLVDTSTYSKLTLRISYNDNGPMLRSSVMSLPRNVSKRIADRLKRHKAVVVVGNNKGKASRVFGLTEYLEKGKLAKK